MTELNTLRDINSREAARVLAALSSSLLPQPGINETSIQPELDSRVLKSVLAEIRQRLKLREDDFSITTQAKIYAFLSGEISKAALANSSEKSVKDRLGNKGELRPSQYQVSINEEKTKLIEALGIKRQHIVEAITHPDEVVHLHGSYPGDEKDIRPTISMKSVTGRRADADFSLLVISDRIGQTQEVGIAFRAYHSEVDLRDIRNPLDALRAFAKTYGLTFQFGGTVSRYLENEVIGVSKAELYNLASPTQFTKPIEGTKGTYYCSIIAFEETQVQAPHAEATVRIVFAFIVDVSKYTVTMRRHKVPLTPEEHWKFSTI